MTDENRRAAIAAAWERAEEALADAELLHASARHAGAASRAYYAAFHAASALLFSLGLQPRSHRGVRSLIGLHFVRTGRLAATHGRALSQMARAREDADYDAAISITAEDADEALARAREFTKTAHTLLKNDGWLGGSSPR